VTESQSFEGLTNRQVLQCGNDVAEELFQRGLITSLTSSFLGGYAEHLVARRFGTEPLRGSDAGFDLVRPDTQAKVQVKARRHGPDKTKTHFGDFGMLEQQRFDEFVGVVFGWDWSIEECWHMPWEAVDTMARLVNDKHRLYFTDARSAAQEGRLEVVLLDLNNLE
jgi:hypothetical protein